MNNVIEKVSSTQSKSFYPVNHINHVLNGIKLNELKKSNVDFLIEIERNYSDKNTYTRKQL